VITLATHRGPRPTQEDAVQAVYLPKAEVVIAAVADGVGKRAYGAAGRVMDVCFRTIRRAQRRLVGVSAAAVPRVLTPILFRALDAASLQTGGSMDTTLLLTVAGRGWFSLLHVGDSRAWMSRYGELHPLVQPHGTGHIVQSTVGHPHQIDLLHVHVQQQGLLVLASDGIAEPWGTTASEMVATQVAKGAYDNTTALVMNLHPTMLDSEIGLLATL